MVTNLEVTVAAAKSAPTRQSAAERREAIVAAAIAHFAQDGYRAASTEAIARVAGISQPYLFRLFGTKRDLFLACHERIHAQVIEAFRAAAAAAEPGSRLMAMGGAYVALLEDRETLLFQMQSYAACADPEVQAQVRARYADLVGEVRELSGAGPADLWFFCSAGMLLNVVAALGIESLAGEEEWAARFIDPKPLLEEIREGMPPR